MRLSNNIHNVCELEGAQLVQEWTEEEKIPVKMGPANPPPKTEAPKDAKKEGEAEPPKEGEQPAAPEGEAKPEGE